MTERERLIELLNKGIITVSENYGMPNSTELADYLLQNGVTVPPCKIGDTIHRIVRIENSKINPFIVDEKIIGISPFYRNVMGGISNIDTEDFGVTVFLTHEEAESVLKECEKYNAGK